MKTYSAKPADIEKKWVLIDAENLVVGRLASITIIIQPLIPLIIPLLIGARRVW